MYPQLFDLSFPHFLLFFFNDTATTEIYTLSLHDAFRSPRGACAGAAPTASPARPIRASAGPSRRTRSEEHTSELQSLTNLVCRLLLEKKKKTDTPEISTLKSKQPVTSAEQAASVQGKQQ